MGKGSTFTLYLPLEGQPNFQVDTCEDLEALKSIIPPPVQKSSLGSKGKKVLLVDDDLHNIMTAETVLNKKGMKIVISNNKRQALDILQKETDIALILMDISLAMDNEYKSVKEIKSNANIKDIPIIAFTKDTLNDNEERCKEAGADGYITKPFELEALSDTFERWL